jgi:hypothetical protein
VAAGRRRVLMQENSGNLWQSGRQNAATRSKTQ